jgi:hypothetical protein
MQPMPYFIASSLMGGQNGRENGVQSANRIRPAVEDSVYGAGHLVATTL